jgi:predicted dehydrogenase
MRTPVTVGVVGLGEWGPRLVRVFDELPTAELRWLCDESPAALLRLQPRFRSVRTTHDIDDLLADEALDAVVIATPPATHYKLACHAIDADKHVFVETPLALTGEHAVDLVERAERHGRRLMTGHVMLFHPAIQRLKELLDAGRLGDIYYVLGNRFGLGKARHDESVIWDLGTHDVAVALYLLGDEPVAVEAQGGSYGDASLVDAAFCSLTFATGIQAHLHFSWLEPQRTRRLRVVGSAGMALFDDLELERKLSLCERQTPASAGRHDAHSLVGDLVSLRLPATEPLRLECEHFVAVVRSTAEAIAGARESACVVNVLEALQHSLDRSGAPEAVGGAPDSASVVPLPISSF